MSTALGELLRVYGPEECGKDGYPFAWHRGINVAAAMTPAGGWTRDQLAAWGVPWPPPKGWRSALEMPIKDLIRWMAGDRCERCGHPYEKGMGEWSPCDETCKHAGEQRWRMGDGAWMYSKTGTPNRDVARVETLFVEARYRILTVHHLDEDKANCRWWNLVAACQRCHLRLQRAVVMDRPWHYEHSEWFKPYAAGFYAFKYLGEDLDRPETTSRLDELLALEHRFTQESLL